MVMNREWWQHWRNGFQLKKQQKKSFKTNKSFRCDKATNDRFIMNFGLETTTNDGREGASVGDEGKGVHVFTW